MNIEQEITKYLKDAGALKVGFTSQEILKDGPPSTVLSTYMAEAKSAILFAIPMDRELIRSYLAKDNINARSDHEKDNYRTLIKSFKLGLDVKDILVSKGFKAKAVFPNFEYESYDVKGLFKPFPIISLRYLAAMSGFGSLGWSGNQYPDSKANDDITSSKKRRIEPKRELILGDYLISVCMQLALLNDIERRTLCLKIKPSKE